MIVLFDLDGTLLDSTEPVRRSMTNALARFGLVSLTDQELRSQIGPPLRASLATLLAARSAPARLVDPLLEAYRSDYAESSIELAKAYPDTRTMLDQVGAHHRMGVVTSKPRRFAIPILEHLGFADAMEVIEGPRHAESEPKSVTLFRALERLGVSGGETVMIGDRRHDIEAGQAMGTRTIGVRWGYADPGELEDAAPDHIVSEPSEVPKTLR